MVLLVSTTSLFVYIRYYFSTLSSNVKFRLQDHEIAINIFVGFIVFYVIDNKEIPLLSKYVFFIISVLIHIGSGLLILKMQKIKTVLYPRSFLIFHNGKFLKGAILQNKLTEKDILRVLNMKGVNDLTQVDTIILEQDGELSVIFKNKIENVA